MRKNNINLRILFFMLLSIVMIKTNAQTGLNFQGVARTSNNVILASQAITIKLSILQGSATGTADYTETRRVTTNAQGLFTAVIGDTGAISTLGNFTTINWKNTPKFLKIEMDAAAGTNFITMGTTQFQYVAYAQFAKSVDAENIVGIVPVTLGGTGVNNLAALKTALAIDKAGIGLSNVDNTSDLTKPISTATQTALDSKVATSTFSTTIATKANLSVVELKAPIESPTFTGTVGGITKSMVGLSGVDNTSDINKPISSATQTALDSKVSSTTFSTTLNTKVSTETFSATIATKENTVNKSTATDLGASATSDILFPTQKAVKTYVDAQINSGGVADGSITSIKLADGAVTGAKFASSITGYKNFVDGAGKLITSNNATPDLILPTGSVPTGGASVWQSFVPTASGKLSLIEFETGNPSSLSGMPPIAYVEIYVGEGIGGTLLGRSNDFTISMFGRTWKSFEFNSIVELYTGNTYTARLVTSTSNQDWVYGDNNLYNDGKTNVSSTWDHNFKTSLKVFTNDEFLTTTVGQNLISSIVSNATHTGEVTGATSLTITDGVVSTAKISDGAVTTAKLANTAVDLTSKVTGLLPTSNIADGAITTAKLANTSVDLSTKVTGLLPTANIADGAITSSKISNGEVGLTNKVSGILPTSNGGTGTATSTANLIFATPNGTSGAPIFRSLVSADLPTNLSGYIQNAPSSAQSASININGSIIAGGLQNTPIGNATSSSGAFTTLTTSGTASVGGTLTVTGVATFSETPILSTTSASKALFTNSNKGIVSNNITGTGNVVMSANPTLTGNVTLETITSSKDLSVNGINIGVGKGNFNTNTAIGSNPMFSNTSGEGNIAIGYQSLFLNTTGSYNTGLGFRSLTNNNGNNNIAIGNASLFENTSGGSNIALGNQSLHKNTVGSNNLGFGDFSLNRNTSGNNNIAFGDQSLTYNTNGSYNFAAGYLSLLANISGSDNIAIGDNSLFFNNANNNIGLGKTTLFYNQNGASNYAGGYKALFNNTSGSYNIAIGFESLKTNSTASNNIGIGKSTLTNLQNGINNIAIGNNAGFNSLYTTNNIIIGNDAQASSDIADNEITLGNSTINTLRAQVTSITALSDRRDKTDIQTISEGIDFIKQLKPVTYTWNTRDKSKVGIKAAGFIAQDLLTLQKTSSIGDNLDLVSENNPEKLEARYNNLLPVMVKAIQEQQNIIEDQKKRLEVLEKLVAELIKK